MSTLSLSPVSAGVYSALNQSSLTALLGTSGGPHDTEVPQRAVMPFVWFVATEANARGMGRGGLRRVDLRVHAAAQAATAGGAAKILHAIQAVVVTLLEDATLTVTGYRMGGEVFYDFTTDPVVSEVNGVPCWENVANFYFWVEPTS